MGFSNIAKIAKGTKALVALLGMSVSFLTLMPILPAYADTSIGVTICGPDLTSTLTIDSPVSDSIVNTSPIKVSGAVSNATQIETYVDDQFNGVAPLSDTDTSYDTTIAVNKGTHTIKLVAVNACNQGNAEASVVITYQPATPPSDGSKVPTSTPGQPNGPGAGKTPAVHQSPVPPQNPIASIIPGPIQDIAKDLNLTGPDTSSKATRQTSIPNLYRFGLLLLGAILIFASTPLSSRLYSLAKRFHFRVLATAHAVQEERITLIVAGLLSIVLMFTL